MSTRTTRLMSALVLSAAAGPLLGVAPAHAAPISESASSAGYFNALGPQDTGTPVGTPPNLATMADGVAEGDLGVQGGSGQEQKVSFLMFPGTGLEPGATVSSAVLTVPLATGDGNVSASAAPEKVRACAIGEEGFGGEDGTSLMVAPTRKCDVFSAPAKASADGKAYVFDVTGLARLWTEANDGLALTVAEGADTTAFQVVFQGGDAARLVYDATPPADAAGGDSGGEDTGAEEAASGDTGGSGGSGTTDLAGGFGSGMAPAGDLLAPDDLGGSSGDAPLTAPLDAAPLAPAEPEVNIGPAPEAAPDILAQPVGNDGVVREPTLTPGAAFWFGLGALGALLALVSLVLGDTDVRRPSAGSSSRLTQALQARRQPGASAGQGLALGRS